MNRRLKNTIISIFVALICKNHNYTTYSPIDDRKAIIIGYNQNKRTTNLFM